MLKALLKTASTNKMPAIAHIGLAIMLASQALSVVAGESPSVVDSFEKVFGVTEGKRRNHTKGFCFSAELVPQGTSIQKYSNSALFTQPAKVIGRLSHKGGNNHAPDNKPGEYGMGLAITLASGEQQRMSMNTLDFFPVATPEAFAELMRAKVQGKASVKEFKKNNADLQRFKKHMSTKKRELTPYEGTRYNSVNSFYLVNKAGDKTAVRWSFIPEKKQSIVVTPSENFFFENMQKNLTDHALSWNMQVTIANENDAVNNASIPWQGEHEKIIAAKLNVLSISTEQSGQCADVNFDPLVLATGFEPSQDPLLQARRNAYAISFGKRLSEKQAAK